MCAQQRAERRRARAQVLREAEGALELVNVSDSLPELRRVPGLHTWGVQAKEGFFTSWEAAQAVRCLLFLLATRCILCSAAAGGVEKEVGAGGGNATGAQHVPARTRGCAASGALPARAAAPR